MKKMILLINSVTLLLFSSGCWSSQELNDSAFLSGMAIEKADDQIKVTFQILQPTKMKKNADNAGVLISSTAPTLHLALRRLIKGIKRRVYLSQTRVVIVSEEVAKEDIFSVLDLLYRDQQFRLKSYLFIADKPAEILGMQSPLDSLSAYGLSSGTEAVRDYLSEIATVTVKEFMDDSMRPTKSSYVTMLKIHHEKKPATSHIDLDGIAILKNGKLVKESPFTKGPPGILWFKNEIKTGSVAIPIGKHQYADIELLHGSTKMKPRFVDDKLVIDVYVKAKGDLTELQTSKDLNNITFKEYEKKFGEEIKKKLEETLTLLRKDPATDTIYMGLEVYRHYPKYWHKIRKDWGKMFKTVEVNIHVDATLVNIGLIRNNFRPKTKGKLPDNSIIPWIEKKEGE